MKKVLLTGGSGFVGSNVLPFLKEKYYVFAPTRSELDVRNLSDVLSYISKNKFDVIVHLASPSPVRSADKDSYDRLFEDCLKIFMNFYSVRDECEKIIYSGSGAEFDKRWDIHNVRESDIGKKIPVDDYGRAKYIMNDMARSSQNIYNLRIFGCFGPREYDSKFITHAIRCCLKNEPITIKQDCFFDYLYIDNYAQYLQYFIDNTPKYHDYNACSGQRILLSDIAKLVAEKMENAKKIQILQEGFNKEYTASNERIMKETGLKDEIISVSDGIDKLIKWEKKTYEKKSC